MTIRPGPSILSPCSGGAPCPRPPPEYEKGGGFLRFLQRMFRFFFKLFRAIVWSTGLIAIAIICYFYVAARPVPRETLGRLLP